MRRISGRQSFSFQQGSPVAPLFSDKYRPVAFAAFAAGSSTFSANVASGASAPATFPVKFA